MKTSDLVQTAILATGFFALVVFGASYYFMFLDVSPTQQPLKDALSITATAFGGFATLTAAFIASRLFNDWRHEKKFEILNSEISKINSTLKEINEFIVYEFYITKKYLESTGKLNLENLKTAKADDTENREIIIDEIIHNIDISIFPVVGQVTGLALSLNRSTFVVRELGLVNNETISNLNNIYSGFVKISSELIKYKQYILSYRVSTEPESSHLKDFWVDFCKIDLTDTLACISKVEPMLISALARTLEGSSGETSGEVVKG